MIKHFFLRNEGGHPFGCVALQLDGVFCRVAASVCSKHDKWDRKLAVRKAVGRLGSHTESVEVSVKTPLAEILDMLGLFKVAEKRLNLARADLAFQGLLRDFSEGAP